jgi:transposase
VLSLPAQLRVFVATTPVDLRGSFDALAGHVRRMGLEPTDGHLYVFFNRRKHLIAILAFDRTGYCLFRKRLERGTFQLPEAAEGADRVCVDGRTLASILEGIDLAAPRRRWYTSA